MHPDDAAKRGLAAGDMVDVRTKTAAVRAHAALVGAVAGCLRPAARLGAPARHGHVGGQPHARGERERARRRRRRPHRAGVRHGAPHGFHRGRE
ncbi:MAG: hypothetical protein IPG17_21035 [Sandaracinaceae bacterium]|nr:hypothetical protein [Sandaracinaceae bacterium]